jgi:hypothetical protein
VSLEPITIKDEKSKPEKELVVTPRKEKIKNRKKNISDCE